MPSLYNIMQLHEQFPEILNWKIDDAIHESGSGSAHYRFQGIVNNQIVLQRSRDLHSYRVLRKSICNRNSLVLKRTDRWFGAVFDNESLADRLQEAQNRALREALDGSQYNEFLIALAEAQKQLAEEYNIG